MAKLCTLTVSAVAAVLVTLAVPVGVVNWNAISPSVNYVENLIALNAKQSIGKTIYEDVNVSGEEIGVNK